MECVWEGGEGRGGGLRRMRKEGRELCNRAIVFFKFIVVVAWETRVCRKPLNLSFTVNFFAGVRFRRE